MHKAIISTLVLYTRVNPANESRLCKTSGAHPEFSLGGRGGGADPHAIYNLCLILKIEL
jgi:hypothetical protein